MKRFLIFERDKQFALTYVPKTKPTDRFAVYDCENDVFYHLPKKYYGLSDPFWCSMFFIVVLMGNGTLSLPQFMAENPFLIGLFCASAFALTLFIMPKLDDMLWNKRIKTLETVSHHAVLSQDFIWNQISAAKASRNVCPILLIVSPLLVYLATKTQNTATRIFAISMAVAVILYPLIYGGILRLRALNKLYKLIVPGKQPDAKAASKEDSADDTSIFDS
ncbi:MAG: hypothetical protein IJP01_04260 [Oscillospiraceae bacterium]|nr:hypothetical protein [Oscillospiraceae bacterium]